MTETTYDLGDKWKAIVGDSSTRFFNPSGALIFQFQCPIADPDTLDDMLRCYQYGLSHGAEQGKREERRRLRSLLGVEE